MRVAVLVFVCVAAPLALRQAVIPIHAQTSPQQPPTTFRGGVNLIQWDVSVYDAKHQPVKGLSQDDFTLLEDGKTRPLLGFVEIASDPPPPPTAAWMRDAESDVATNDVEGNRIFLLVIDDASFGNAIFWQKTADRVREIAATFFAHLQSNDLVAVVFTGDNRRSQEFTTDHGKLLTAVKNVSAPAMDPRLLSRYATDILRRATEYLLAAPGRRKAIVDITAFNMAMSDADLSVEAQITKEMIEIAQRANVSVSMIHPVADPALSEMPSDNWLMMGLESGWFLRVPHETGGEAIRNVGDQASATAAVERVLATAGNYYLLGYVSEEPKKFHQIKVTVNRPDLIVRARERFYPMKDDKVAKSPAPPPLLKSIEGILPNSSIRMRANAAPFAPATGSCCTLAMTVAVRQILATAGEMPGTDDVQFRVAAFTPDGKPRGAKVDEVRVVLRPNRNREAEYEMLSTIDLEPGLYSLRVSAHSKTFETAGSVYLTVDVPNFEKQPVSLSGVLLNATLGLPISPRDALAGLVPIVPTAQRTFARGQPVTAFLRVYRGNDKSAASPLRIRILDDHDRPVLEETRTLESVRSADVSYTVPTARLAAGQYLLTFETGAGKTAARRDVRFSIR
jgi:VWFA-related protein